MSYLGSVGYVRKKSARLELFSTIYAEKSVKNMLYCKQYKRTMRAHDLSTALKKIILKQIAVSNDAPFQDVAAKCEELLENGVIDLFSVWNRNKFWVLSIKTVDLFHINLMVERSRSWNIYLYIYSLECILPYFPGTGHNSYGRSLH